MTRSFSEILPEIRLEELSAYSAYASRRDVEAALSSDKPDLADLAALISPLARDEYLEALAARAHELTIRRFGRTIHLFAPLYISNECVSTCTYCGFSRENDIVRTTLTPDEVATEADHLLREGFRHLLLVSGEHRRIVSRDYLCEVVATLATRVPQISLEVQVWPTEIYRDLRDAGCDGIVVYQETYDREIYEAVHLRGMKRKYEWRLDALERAAAAGIRRLGTGALLGLSTDWRRDVLALAAHTDWLTRKAWRAEISIALPRLRPCAGGIEPAAQVSDREFALALAALRVFLPDVGIVLSTREGRRLRDGLLKLGVTQMSAGSRTEPGGYTLVERHAEPQFEVEDLRTPEEVMVTVKNAGYDAVWKDWARV